MKSTIVSILLVFTTIGFSQDKFDFNEKGLAPEYIIAAIDSIPKNTLYKKTLKWIKSTSNNLEIQNKTNTIQFTGIKDNAVHEGKRYFHIKYTIKISFEEGLYKFKPLKVQLKANSKYDMGWKAFDLKKGDIFFKKGKVIKKFKSYVSDIPKILNDLNANLYNYLITED
ncbi:hypothetical protein [uncultured Winogradskyella sp.]|uniref:hypothetical protein n=1 Tax=uncultured Winogradskyella sp. TaxID=395353 RepID=UPI002617FE3E|nr:hypothetical protein [uncultured Winogradskyella sp.]